MSGAVDSPLTLQAEAAFCEAVARCGVSEHGFNIADRGVRLRFAGDAMRGPLLRAFAHLPPATDMRTDLLVSIWDGASTGVAFPPSALAHGADTGKLVVGASPERAASMYLKLDSGAASMFEPDGSTGWFFAPDATRVSAAESGAPLLALLHGWSVTQGLLAVHAAAVGTAQGGVLLVGRGGSGKSTTALACARSGLGYVGDDYCLLAPGAQTFAHSLYCSAKVDGRSIERLGIAVPDTSPTIGAKRILFAGEHGFAAPLASCPIRAVLLPAVHDQDDTCITRVSPATALRALAPSTLLQLPGAARTALQRMARAIGTLPCYELQLGRDPDRIPPRVRAVLES